MVVAPTKNERRYINDFITWETPAPEQPVSFNDRVRGEGNTPEKRAGLNSRSLMRLEG